MRLAQLGDLGTLREGCSVCPAGHADAGLIAAIYNESVDVGDASADKQHRPVEYFEQLIAGYNSRECYLLLEDVNSGLEHSAAMAPVVGWGQIKHYSDRTGYYHTCETAVYLRRALTRRGYGAMLKRAIIERCIEWRYHHLLARLFADNAASLNYNLRFGYEIVGRQREICWVDGAWRDTLVLQLLLEDVVPGQGQGSHCPL